MRRIIVDHSVRYTPKSEQTRENKPIMMKNRTQSEQIQPSSGGGKPNTRKQNKNISQNNRKFLKKVTAIGFKYLK